MYEATFAPDSVDPLGTQTRQKSLLDLVFDMLGADTNRAVWQNEDFLKWYFEGGGQDVDIEEIGLLGPWWRHVRPQFDTQFRSQLLNGIVNDSDVSCPDRTGDVVEFDGQEMEVSAANGLHGTLTNMGQSKLKIRGTCRIHLRCVCHNGQYHVSVINYDCNVTVNVRDPYENPLDKGGYFNRYNPAGATPYDLIAEFDYNFRGSSIIDDATGVD